MSFIKKMFFLICDGSRRFLNNQIIKIKFLRKNSIIRRPLHVQNLKCIKIYNNVRIDYNGRLDCYKNEGIIPTLEIGEDVMIGFNFTALCSSKLTIGSHTVIASNVFITTENHGINPLDGPYLYQELISKDVIIGSNCWIGEKSCILPGVKIGDFSIIGANSVVTHDIPSYSIAVGNPAKIIKIFDKDLKVWKTIKM